MAQLITSTIYCRWVDLYGREKMIVMVCFNFVVSETLSGLGSDVQMFFEVGVLGVFSAEVIMPGVTSYVAVI
ncbi:MFS transporter, partial [Bacillus cereus]|nr:MFS transporter [Bacillus cereus]